MRINNILIRINQKVFKIKKTQIGWILYKLAYNLGIVKLYRSYQKKRHTIQFSAKIFNARIKFIDNSPKNVYYKFYLKDRAYEPALTKKIYELLTENEDVVFIDIGAHLGYYTVTAANWISGKGKVYSFEPNAAFFNTLQKNISINNLNTKVEAFQVALSNKMGNARMEGFDSRVMCEDKGGSIGMVTFDHFCNSKSIIPDVVKIDVHGAEGKVLEGMKQKLKEVKHIFVETHGDMMDYKVQDIIRIMENAGLQVYEFTDHRNIEGGKIKKITESIFLNHEDRLIYGCK